MCPLRPTLALLALMGLAACGGGSGGNDSSAADPGPGDVGNYQPMAVGYRWLYTVTEESTDGSAPVTYSRQELFSGTRKVAGTEALIYRSINPDTLVLEQEGFVSKTGRAIHQHFLAGATPFGVGQRSFTLLRLPLEAGDTYQTTEWRDVDVGIDYDSDSQNETATVRTVVSVLGVEAVTTPAGAFSDALKVSTLTRQVYRFSADGATLEFISRVEEWMVPDLGTVKRVRTLSAPAVTTTSTYLLTGYRVGDLRSDILPPVPTPQPATGSTTTITPALEVAFDESLDAASLDQSMQFTLRHESGALIDIYFNTFTNRHITFGYHGTLPGGSYTFTLSGLMDLLGNELPTQTWSFTVDGTPPTVLSTSPANGATNVSVHDSVVVTFSEDMLASSIEYSAVSWPGVIYYNNADGAQLTLGTQSHQLAHGTTYTLTIPASAKDAHLNELGTPYTFSFTTAPPVFAPIVSTELHTTPEASAVGDLNGDGRNDIALVSSSTYPPDPYALALLVFLQNSDGTLAAPVSFATALPACAPTSVAIGDVTGDAVPDIVVGESTCGIEVFERTAGGSWTSGGRLASSHARQVRLGDMNHDGRLDVVGTGGGNAVAIWYQQAGGGLGTVTTHAVPHSGFPSLALGDFNGDGRTDLVATGNSGGANTHIALMTQSASGGFDTPVTFGTGKSTVMPWSSAIGDVNHDGRADVLIGVGTSGDASELAVRYQQADGSLGPLVYIDLWYAPFSIAIADINADGRNDVVVNHAFGNNFIGLFLQDSSGQLRKEDRYNAIAENTNPDALTLADVNSDGHVDAVVAGQGRLTVLYNAAQP